MEHVYVLSARKYVTFWSGWRKINVIINGMGMDSDFLFFAVIFKFIFSILTAQQLMIEALQYENSRLKEQQSAVQNTVTFPMEKRTLDQYKTRVSFDVYIYVLEKLAYDDFAPPVSSQRGGWP